MPGSSLYTMSALIFSQTKPSLTKSPTLHDISMKIMLHVSPPHTIIATAMQTPTLMQNPFWWHNHSFPYPKNIHWDSCTCSCLMDNFIWSGIECNCAGEKNIVMKVDQKHCPEPLLHPFCCPKIQEKGIELRVHINTISMHYNINS